MSIEAVIGRIDQIVGFQDQILDPTGASATGTSSAPSSTSALAGAAGVGAGYGTSASTATSAPSSTSAADFADELASATQAGSASQLGAGDSGAASTSPSLGETDDSALLSLLSSLGTSGGSSSASATDPTAYASALTDPAATGVDADTDPAATGVDADTDPAALEEQPEELTAAALPADATVPATGLPSSGGAAIGTGGVADAPSVTAVPATSPADPRITAMTEEADSLLGKPYIFGGGHDGWGPQSGYDCSGFVSAVLHAGGYLSSPQDTMTLPSAAGIEAGPGRYVTIYDRAQPGEDGHVIIDIDGQFYESGGEAGSWGGGGGVEKIDTPSAAYLSTFDDVLHPAGL